MVIVKRTDSHGEEGEGGTEENASSSSASGDKDKYVRFRKQTNTHNHTYIHTKHTQIHILDYYINFKIDFNAIFFD